MLGKLWKLITFFSKAKEVKDHVDKHLADLADLRAAHDSLVANKTNKMLTTLTNLEQKADKTLKSIADTKIELGKVYGKTVAELSEIASARDKILK